MFRDGVAADAGEHLDLVAARPAEKRVNRLADGLSENVPERNVDGAQSREDDRAGEMGVARNRLEVMLDPAGVLADKILREIVDRLEDEPVMCPEAGLARPYQSFVRVH